MFCTRVYSSRYHRCAQVRVYYSRAISYSSVDLVQVGLFRRTRIALRDGKVVPRKYFNNNIVIIRFTPAVAVRGGFQRDT